MTHANFNNPDHLKNQQYKTAGHLSARIRIHQDYSIIKDSVVVKIFDQILDYTPQGAKILEIGTGRGDLWHENRHRIPELWDITLTDISAGMISDQQAFLGDTLTKRFSYDVVNANEPLPYADNSFDTVLANYMLYHVSDVAQTLSEIRRVLKPDGVLFAATNGEQHLKMMYVLAQQIEPDTPFSSVFAQQFGLQNGTAQLLPFFTDIRMLYFQNDLWVTVAQPIIDYIASMVGVDGASVIAERETDIRENLNRLIAKDGGILIGKQTGMFIAQGVYQSFHDAINNT